MSPSLAAKYRPMLLKLLETGETQVFDCHTYRVSTIHQRLNATLKHYCNDLEQPEAERLRWLELRQRVRFKARYNENVVIAELTSPIATVANPETGLTKWQEKVEAWLAGDEKALALRDLVFNADDHRWAKEFADKHYLICNTAPNSIVFVRS